MLTAADVMTKDVAMIRSSATVKEAVDLMRIRDWRALIIDRRHEQDAYGIITESDIVYKVISYSKDPNKVRVYEIMTKPCIVVNPDLGVEYVARLFAHTHIRRAPVIKGKLLGIISITDILRKSDLFENPKRLFIEDEIEVAREEARAICTAKGDSSGECASAWDIVEELLAVASHQRVAKENIQENIE